MILCPFPITVARNLVLKMGNEYEEVAIWPSTIPDRRVMSCMLAVPDGDESRTRHMLVVLAI